MRTEVFEDYVEPARRYPQIWRLLIGVLVIMASYLLPVVGLFALLNNLDVSDKTFANILDGSTPFSVAFWLGTMAPISIGLWLVVKWLHKRSFLSLFGANHTVVQRDFILAIILFGAVQGLALLIASQFFPFSTNLSLDTWALWLPVFIVLLLLQTGVEEVAFRGYLMQQLAARFQNPFWWFILPQVIFAILHFEPETYGSLTWIVILAIFISGLIWADLTRVTGSLGAAWGLHFANNFMMCMIVAHSGNLDGTSLFVAPFGTDQVPAQLILADLLVQVVCWMILRRWLQLVGSKVAA